MAESKFSNVKKEVFSPGPSTSTISFTLLPQTEEKPVIKEEKPDIPIKREIIDVKPIVPLPLLQPIQSPPKKNKIASHSISIDAYREKKEKERIEQKPTLSAAIPEVLPQQPFPTKLPQPALSDPEKVYKDILSSLELPLKVDKAIKLSVNPKEQLPSDKLNKMNHQMLKVKSPVEMFHNKEVRIKIPSGVSSDPIVVLERVDVKTEVQDLLGPEVVPPQSISSTRDPKHPVQGESVCNSKDLPLATTVSSTSVAVTKSKHPKHKTNSFHNSHISAQPIYHKLSPIRDLLKTNGSKETDPYERRNAVVENNVSHKSEVAKHEKREKHKSKHSSKDKSISNHTEHSDRPIKVKIRKDIINLPPKPLTPENPKKSLKIKLPKPPAAYDTSTSSIKLFITKDKSGSGSYCTSHKNDRESKKRAHSPASHDSNYKHYGETSSKHAKLEHGRGSHPSVKQSKSRHSSSRNVDHTSNDVGSGKMASQHLANNSYSYLNVDVESYGSQPYYNNQYYPYQTIPPPPGHRAKTNSNPPLPPPLPAQPPPPPPPE